MIKLIIGNSTTSVDGYLEPHVYKSLRANLGYRPEDAIFMARNMPHWDGIVSTLCYKGKCKCPVKKDKIHFPTGLLGKAWEVFDRFDLPYEMEDSREPVPFTDQFSLSTLKPLRQYQTDIVETCAKRGRGIVKLATGGGKCLGKGTPVLMFDGTIKPVEQVIVGDQLMGPDSKPRAVLSTCTGREMMYQVTPVKGDSYVVNESHILSLQMYRRRVENGIRRTFTEIINISIKDYLSQTKTFKHCAKGYRSAVDFPPQPIGLDPYYLGIWLGDGTSRNAGVTTADEEIKAYLKSFAAENDTGYWEQYQKSNASVVCHLTNGRSGGRHNTVLTKLRDCKVIQNKHVPHSYRSNTRDIRLQVLAGLMDSDGHATDGSGYDFVSKYKTLADDVAFLARSLGLAAYISPCRKTCVNNGVEGDYFRVSISGDCSIIPVKIPRKQCRTRLQKKNVLVTGITVEPAGVGDYYGFEIDGDHLFLLGDFTVTHNTVVAAGLIARMGVWPFIFYVPSQDLLRQAYEELSAMVLRNGLPVKVGRVGGGYRDIQDITVMTVQSAVRALDPGRFETKLKNGKTRKKKIKLFIGDEDLPEEENELGEYRNAVKNLIMESRGCICDEVQHWASETCQLVADYSLKCRYRFGFSATPWRDMGDDILIDACFGKVIGDINASYLIEHGHLVQPTIYFVPVDNMKKASFDDYHEAYELGIVRNELRNTWIANMAKNLSAQGRQILVLVKHIAHGELLEELIPGSVFLHGSKTAGQRKEHIDLMRTREARITIASTIFDEGIDVRPLDGLILAGSGKSQTRALQRIGRVIRPFEINGFVKKDAVVVDFIDDMKWMRGHSKAREKMYQSEPKFIITHVNSSQYAKA